MINGKKVKRMMGFMLALFGSLFVGVGSILFASQNQALGLLAFGSMGLIAFSTGVWLVFSGHLRKWRNDHLKKTGIPQEADLIRISRDHGRAVNNEAPFVLDFKGKDLEGNPKEFTSDPIWFDPFPYIDRKKTMVYVKDKKARKYFTDISFLPERGN